MASPTIPASGPPVALAFILVAVLSADDLGEDLFDDGRSDDNDPDED